MGTPGDVSGPHGLARSPNIGIDGASVMAGPVVVVVTIVVGTVVSEVSSVLEHAVEIMMTATDPITARSPLDAFRCRKFRRTDIAPDTSKWG